MTLKVGDKLPENVTLYKMSDSGPEAVTVAQLFGDKKVVLFALPGAFTPTCSGRHLPGFIEKYSDIKAKNVDDVICLAVNDAFVMDAWGKSQGADGKITMIADGNGDFTRAVGLQMDGSGAGMGERSQRYVMVVDDGVVRHLNVDPPKTCQVSGAESLLALL